MCDDVCGHDSVHVLAGRFVTDLVKGCERIACPGETMEGECSCPAEVVHHSDGNVYLMEEVVSAMCGANMRLRVVVVEYYTARDRLVQACASAFSVRRSS